MRNKTFFCLECGATLTFNELRSREGEVECPVCLEKNRIKPAEDILQSETVQNLVQGIETGIGV